MIYKFKSKATGDVIMLAASAEPILRLVGKAPAAQGIFEVADMPGVIDSLERAVADAEAAREQAEREAAAEGRRTPAGPSRGRGYRCDREARAAHRDQRARQPRSG